MHERNKLLPAVLDSFRRLTATFDLIIVEGAGSPAETNLRAGDIANMGFAQRTQVPVCLVADIERGGVIASLVGTQAVLETADADLIKGFIVNKFRGDPRLFDDGLDVITTRTGWPSFGVVPWLPAIARLPAEDAVAIQAGGHQPGQTLQIAAPMLSRLANFDDADPLRQQHGVSFEWITPGRAIPRSCDVIVLFGTKSTLSDLAFLRAQGWDHDILAHARTGGHVIGVCGGFQLLGRRIHDPAGMDGPAGSATGLGLLDVETTMIGAKTVRPVTGTDRRSGEGITGYEIHTGTTAGPDCDRPMFELEGRADGAVSANGRVAGTYLHGMFANDAYRAAWLRQVGAASAPAYNYRALVETALDQLADHVEAAIDFDALLATAQHPTLGEP